MTMQSILKTFFMTAGLLAMASAATADGNMIAGSAKSQTLRAAAAITLASGLSDLDEQGTDVCATIVNRSDKTGLIELTLTDVFAATSSSQIAKAKSSALCGKDIESVAVSCVGPSKCAFTWSIDRF